MKYRIIIIDDHKLVLQGLYEKLKLVEQFEVVGAFTDIEDLMLCLNVKKIDIIITDFMLKDTNAFELIKSIKDKYAKEFKYIIVSGFYESLLHKRSIELGVSAFLKKEASYDELISTIINVAEGNHVIPSILIDDDKTILTDAELKVINLVAKEYTNERISKELFISRRTVETHVSNICQKLNVNTRIGAVLEASKLGLLKS